VRDPDPIIDELAARELLYPDRATRLAEHVPGSSSAILAIEPTHWVRVLPPSHVPRQLGEHRGPPFYDGGHDGLGI